MIKKTQATVDFPYNFTNEYNNNDQVLGSHFDANFMTLADELQLLNDKLQLLKTIQVLTIKANYVFDSSGNLIVTTDEYSTNGNQVTLTTGLTVLLDMNETLPCKKALQINIDNTGLKPLYIDSPTFSRIDSETRYPNLRGCFVNGENTLEYNAEINGWFYRHSHLTGAIVSQMSELDTYPLGYLRLDGTNNGWVNMEPNDIYPIVNAITSDTKVTIDTADATPVQIDSDAEMTNPITPECMKIYEGQDNIDYEYGLDTITHRNGTSNRVSVFFSGTGDFKTENINSPESRQYSLNSINGSITNEGSLLTLNKTTDEVPNLSNRYATIYYLKL